MSDYYIENTVRNRRYLENLGYSILKKTTINHNIIAISDSLSGEKICEAVDKNIITDRVYEHASDCAIFKEEGFKKEGFIDAIEKVKVLEGVEDRPSPYHLKNVFKQKEYFDWYDYIDAVRVTGIVLDPRVEHVIKKLFVNDRGHKSIIKDVSESIKTLQMYLDKIEGDDND